MTVKDMIKKEIDTLPENILVEVYDFVRFLEIRKDRELLQKVSQALSEKYFNKIWDNKEDAVYDSL